MAYGMLANSPPGDSYNPSAVNRQTTQGLSTPGRQSRPSIGQNLTQLSNPLAHGMPQLSANPLDPQAQQRMAMIAALMGGGGGIS